MRGGVPHARELGWDDSLYEGEQARPGAGAPGRGASVPGPATPSGQDGPGEPAAGSAGKKQSKAARGAGSPPRVTARGKRVLRWSAGTLSFLILATAGAGYLYYEHLNGNIRSDARSGGSSGVRKPGANAAGQTPLNILMIGSDSRASAANVKLGGSKENADNPPLADVQMLIHISADRKNASVVSVPRDTRVDIPECKDAKTGQVYPKTNGIINETLARGGPGCTLSTWENLTGIYIDHWMTIDFAGVVAMADAIGGVDVCVKQGLWDRPIGTVGGGSGLKLKKGTTKVQGEQALQWLRTRHAWGSDPLRAKAQHMYLNSMIRELKSQSVFTDTGRLTGLAEAATKSLEVSKEIGTVKKLYDLAMQLKSVPTDRLTSVTMPTLPDPQDPDNHLVANQADTDKLWTFLRDDVALDANGAKDEGKKTPAEPVSKDPAAKPSETGVTVLNGTGGGAEAPVSGRAGVVADLLTGKGYTLAKSDTRPVSEKSTTVTFPSADLEGDAQQVAKSLGIPLTSVKRSTDVSGVTLVVGADWRSGSTYPKQEKPKAGGIPDTSDAINGSDTKACMDVYAPYVWPQV
ncbi:LCP family protein [Streptomyces sp. 150FB]|uniref:LCP family protein n=1 Tax=Streptomyces sp. 150FB TaxID=1576605 RepID=UPI00099C2A6A|nr:LCP family protein [Streptomyces sp. 150FB]